MTIGWRGARRAVQLSVLAAFTYTFIQAEYRGLDVVRGWWSAFTSSDPLCLTAVVAGSRSWPLGLSAWWLLAIAVGLSPPFLARAFCGWVCPLGTLNHAVSAARERSRIKWAQRTASRYWKYRFVILALVLSFFGVPLAFWFSPLPLLYRSATLAVHPAVNLAGQRLSSGLLSWHEATGAEPLYSGYQWLRDSVLSFHQPYFQHAGLNIVVLLVVLGINVLAFRMWCRSFCPLGGFLGIIGHRSLLRRTIQPACNHCAACVKACPADMGATPEEWNPSECLLCFRCAAACRKQAVEFSWRSPWRGTLRPVNVPRRDLSVIAIAGIAILAASRLNRISPAPNGRLIRPPGALPEPEFLARCLRCGECMRICPTNAIQPAGLAAGWEGAWTPVIVPETGYCELECNLCSRICPTGALKRVTAGERKTLKLGTAVIDRGRCLPHAMAIPCLVCEEHCPVTPKAIWVREKDEILRDGTYVKLGQPIIDPQRCVGCGVCEHKCPVQGSPAIYVRSFGETRAPASFFLSEFPAKDGDWGTAHDPYSS